MEQLQHDGCTVCMTATIDQCKEAARRDIPVLALLDPPSGDHARAWVLELMMIDAGMHTAVVTEMDDEVFEGMYLSGIKPADLPNVKDQEEYAAWIKAHPNGLAD